MGKQTVTPVTGRRSGQGSNASIGISTGHEYSRIKVSNSLLAMGIGSGTLCQRWFRVRAFLRSPVREIRTPGSARGAPGNRCPYLNRQEMKSLNIVFYLAAFIATFARAELEPVGESGPHVRVVICGVANSPKEVTLPAGAGVRGALFLSNNASSDYGWVPRIRIRRGERLYQSKPANQPDARLEDGDFLEIPLRAPYQEMAEPRRILIEVDSSTKFSDSLYIQPNFDFAGIWRTNWWDGIAGRENRLTDEHSYHSTFICPVPINFRVAKSPEEPQEIGSLDDKKNYFLITFREIRAIDQPPKFADRELEIVTKICRKLGGTPYLLQRDFPNYPWITTPFGAAK
jgi:hypothetical protein